MTNSTRRVAEESGLSCVQPRKPRKPAVRCTGWLGDVKAALRLLEKARIAGEKRLSNQEWNRLLNAEIAIEEVIESQRRRSPSKSNSATESA